MAADHPLLHTLNDAQQAAVLHHEGPAMIIAGAGSGKTRVLTHRLAYLIQEHRVDPHSLLALTFTNKAADEMRHRLGGLIGPEARGIAAGTFHSIFARILRAEAEHLGFTRSFTIYDEEDANNLVKSLVKEMGYDDKRFKPKNIRYQISNAKNYLVSPERFAEEYVDDELSAIAAKLYPLYVQRCQRANAMDFDDLLYNMVVLMQQRPEVSYKYQHRFRHLMVDEYQDTNYAQYIIVKRLASEHENLCVVGDDAQSIYSFRGANLANILNFQRDFPDVNIYKLEQNYRSTATIVELANGVIKFNKHQIPKTIFTANQRGEPVHLMVGQTEVEEAHKVVDRIRELKAGNFPNRDIAILYRTNAQSRVLEDDLRRAGITYRIFGGQSFYKRKEIKDVLAYLRLTVNPDDEEALKRVINYPARGIGDTSRQRLLVAADQHGVTLWQACKAAPSLGIGRSARAITDFCTLIESFRVLAKKETAFDLVDHVAKQTGILKDLHKENNVESLSRWENVQELINAAKEFTERENQEDTSLEAFLQEVSLFSDQDETAEDDDYVTLMTVHASKGLEFRAVFLVGLEEGLFPSQMSMNDRESIEEERRLFYVAVTRAKERLFISNAVTRNRFGKLEANDPSRFLDELNEDYIKREQLPNRRNRDQLAPSPFLQRGKGRSEGGEEVFSKPQLTPEAVKKLKPLKQAVAASPPPKGDDLSGLELGQTVEHHKFGRGVVKRLDGQGDGRRAIVEFEQKGVKTLLLKYARLSIVNA